MIKNKIHCLVINEPNNIKAVLASMLGQWDGKVIMESIDNSPSTIIKKLIKGNINLLFSSSTNKKQLENYKTLLRRYAIDTILVNPSKKNHPLRRDLSGIESCSICLDDKSNAVIVNNLLSYAQIKSDFRHCKHLLTITDKRNRWLVNITPEPIAYIYKGTHIHANAAYLSIFGFQSVAELKSVSIWDLIPDNSHNMFKKFVKKQHRQLNMQQTLLMTMVTADKTEIRTGVRIAPAVINKTKCLQLWIHRIEDNLEAIESITENKASISPWENMPKKKSARKIQEEKTTDQSTAALTQSKMKITSQLNRELTNIGLRIQPLTDASSSSINHYLVSLALDSNRRSKLTTALIQSGLNNTQVFWDRLLLTKLSKELKNSNQKQNQFLLFITEASIRSNEFLNFLIKTVKNVPDKQTYLVLLIPAHLLLDPGSRMIKIRKILATINCSLGIHSFVPTRQSIQKILTSKPSYLSFSNKWVEKQTMNKEYYERFNQLTEKVEEAGIQVILS